MKPIYSGLFISLTLLGLLSIAACNMSVEELCRSRLPGYGEKLDNALVVLRSWEPDRSLAFVTERKHYHLSVDLSLVDRRSWSAWSLERLKEAQAFHDLSLVEPRLRGVRARLTEIANEWVFFDGYASVSQVDRMIIMLDRIRQQSDEVAQKVCTTSPD